MTGTRRFVRLFVLAPLLVAPYGSTPAPPPQPASGPGGSSYPHSAVVTNGPYFAEGHRLKKNYQYYVFEPAVPTPTAAPVVLFLHGWLAYRPNTYLEWIEHIVRKGYIVVWVRYDAGLRLPGTFADNAMVAWRDALDRVATWQGHVPPERDPQGRIKTAMVGHSLGAYLSAILAARAADPQNSTPVPYAVVPVEPGGLRIIPAENFGDIDPATKMVIVVGDDDTVVCTTTAVAIWQETSQIPNQNRDFLLVQTDTYGSPAQVANHFFPTTTGVLDTAEVDARDFYVTFKLSVGALNCAFYATDCEYALGHGSSAQVDMGQWSTGRPVNPMIWVPDPQTLQASCQTR